MFGREVVFVHVPPIEPHATQVTGEVVVTDTLLPVAEEVALVEEELAAARARKRLSGTWLGGSTSGRPCGVIPWPFSWPATPEVTAAATLEV